jgi:phosphonate transport system substrate-binding protein
MRRRRSSLIPLLLGLIASAPVLAAEPFRVGIINERPERPRLALEAYGPFNDYLGARLAEDGMPIGDLVIARSLEEMAARIRAGEVDGLFEGVMPTLKLQRETGRIEPQLVVWRKGQRQYHTIFFTRQDSPIQRLRDLRGKTVAFESPRSTSAHLVPRAVMLESGLTLVQGSSAEAGAGPDAESSPEPVVPTSTEPVRFVFAGSELNQAYWVHAGRAHAGAFNDGDWERVPGAIKPELRRFHRTPSILRWLFSFVGPVDPAVRAPLLETLTRMHAEPAGHAALQAASGIARLEPLTTDDRANLKYWAEALTRLEDAASR